MLGRRTTSARPCTDRPRMGSNECRKSRRVNGIAIPMPMNTSAIPAPIRNQWPAGSLKLPNAFLPAHTTKTAMSDMCAMRPPTELRPTPVSATGSSTPCFCMNLTLSAIPPSPAGASLLANDDPTCVANVGPNASRLGTAPLRLIAAPT